MKLSEAMSNLSAALTAAEEELKNPLNTADNPYFKSKYAPLPDVLNLVRPVLARHGLAVVQSPVTDADHNTGVETLLLHKSGEYVLLDPFYLRPAKADPQTAGGAITYARRYALNALLGISGEEDDDGNAASTPAAPTQKVVCPQCGRTIRPMRGRDGQTVTAAQVLERLGCCAECYKQKKEADNDAD